MEDTQISNRKAEHIQIVLDGDVNSNLQTGFDDYTFLHNALPEIDLSDVDLSCEFLERNLKLPLLISSMTGGTQQAQTINIHLAEAAQKAGVAFGVGSQRATIENPHLASTFSVRKYAPDIPILANLGAIQLNYDFGIDQCKQAVDMIEADALILHLNPLQEALQPEGNTHWKGLSSKIELVIKNLNCPVIVKEEGWGISADLTRQFLEMGAYAVDIAGAGGTSWSQVEMKRAKNPVLERIAANFRNWGIPTAEALVEAHQIVPNGRIIASGGLRNGLDVAKAIGLGAVLGGMAGNLLKAATISTDDVYQKILEIKLEMSICLFAAGIRNLSELSGTDQLRKKA